MAISDPDRSIASPHQTLVMVGDLEARLKQVSNAVSDFDIAEWVVGLPLNMDGSESEQSRLTRQFAEALGVHVGQPVHLWDERLSSYQADVYLAEGELTKKQRKARRDRIAAQIILQSYLDAAGRCDDPDPPQVAGE
ncbi:MAG: Holliday junction resolvase RuvX [bacterium]|nr:Holliday junction resolvase RuvX [bacterium]